MESKDYEEMKHTDLGKAYISAYMNDNSNYLEHYGVKGMKWGVRRYQNKDGSLTNSGKSRYKSNSESDRALMSRIKGDDDVDGWADLQKEINSKSGSWYFGKGVSQHFKKAIADHKNGLKQIDDRYGVTDAKKRLSQAVDEWNEYHTKLTNEALSKNPRYEKLDSKINNLSDKIFDKYKNMSKSELDNYRDEIANDIKRYKKAVKPLQEEKNKIWREMMKSVNGDPTLQKLDDERLKASKAVRNAEQNPERYKEISKFEKEFETTLHGIVLTDLGYRNTERGRKFLIDNRLVYDD